MDTTKNSICDECGKNAPVFGTYKPRLCADCLPWLENLLPAENPFLKKVRSKNRSCRNMSERDEVGADLGFWVLKTIFWIIIGFWIGGGFK